MGISASINLRLSPRSSRRALRLLLALVVCTPSAISAAPPEAQEIRFGSILTLTGAGANWAKNARQGMELARDEINRTGGVRGKPLRILYEDFGELDLQRALSGTLKLIERDHVSALLNFVVEDSEVIAPVLEKNRLISVAVAAGGEKLTQNSSPRFLFRSTSSDAELYRALVEYARGLGRSRACFIVDQTSYFTPMADLTANHWRKTGGQVASFDPIPPQFEDFRSVLLRAIGTRCDAFFLFLLMNNQAAALRQLRAVGYSGMVIGQPTSDDPQILSAAGDAAEGVVFAKFEDGVPAFTASYRQKFGEDPQRPAATAYDAVRMLAHVIEQVGTDPERMRAELLSLRAFSGASGPITIKESQTRLGEVPAFYKIQNYRAERIHLTHSSLEGNFRKAYVAPTLFLNDAIGRELVEASAEGIPVLRRVSRERLSNFWIAQ